MPAEADTEPAGWHDGWLDSALAVPSPNYGPRPHGALIDLLVLHSISLPPGRYGGDAIEIGFNVPYIIDVLSNMGQDMVRIDLADGNSSALITIPENDNFKYVVMPMRI